MRTGWAFACVLAALGTALAEDGESARLGWPRIAGTAASPRLLATPELRPLEAEPQEEEEGPEPLVLAGSDLEAVLGPDGTAAGIRIEPVEGGLLLRGPAAAVAAIGRRWTAFEAFLAGRARVTVTLHDVPPGSLPAAADPAAVAAALAARPERIAWSGTLRTRRGEAAVREMRTARTLVLGLEAEVAQGAGIAGPETAVLRTGRRVEVHCRPLSEREAVVTLSLHLSADPDAVEAVKLAAGTVDLPVVRFLSLLAEARLSVGRPQAIVVDHPFRQGHLAVVVSVDGLPPDADRPAGLVDLAAFAGHPDAADEARAEGEEPGWPDPRAALETALEDEGLGIRPLTPSLAILSGPPEALARAPALLDAAGRTAWLARETWRRPWAAIGDLVDPAGAPADPSAWGEPASVLRAPLPAGTPLVVIRGRWRRYLAGMEVEVAQGAAIVEPAIGEHVEGEVVVAWREGDAFVVRRRTSVLLGIERRDGGVFRDIEGQRGVEPGHLVDILRAEDGESRHVLGAGVETDLRREADEAVLDRISID